MKFTLLTLFPEMFPGHLGHSLAGKSCEKKIWSFNTIQIRDFAHDKHNTVDDTPYGGGAGMVMRPDVVGNAVNSINNPGRLIHFSPRGRPMTQNWVEQNLDIQHWTLLCSRYEGVDQRVLDAHDFEEISIGDYILSGGEVAALTFMDAFIRCLPGAIGNDVTHHEESFSNSINGQLEYPHYTRPAEWKDHNGQSRSVPDVLQSGHHKDIQKWRTAQSLQLTQMRRPDLCHDIHKTKKNT